MTCVIVFTVDDFGVESEGMEEGGDFITHVYAVVVFDIIGGGP